MLGFFLKHKSKFFVIFLFIASLTLNFAFSDESWLKRQNPLTVDLLK